MQNEQFGVILPTEKWFFEKKPTGWTVQSFTKYLTLSPTIEISYLYKSSTDGLKIQRLLAIIII